MYFSSPVVVATLLGVAQAVDVHVVTVGRNPMTNETGLKFYPEKIEAKPGSMVQFQFLDGNHTATQSTFDDPCMPMGMSAGMISGGMVGSQSGMEAGMEAGMEGKMEAGMEEGGMKAGSSSNKGTSLRKLGTRATNSSMSRDGRGGAAMASSAGIFSGFMPVAASMSMGRIPVFTVMINDTKPIWIFCSKGRHCQNGMSMVINENSKANSSRTLEMYKTAAEKVTMSVEMPGGAMMPGGSRTGSGETGRTGKTGRTGEAGETPEGSASRTGTTSEGATKPGQTSAVPVSAASTAAPATLMLALAAAFMLL